MYLVIRRSNAALAIAQRTNAARRTSIGRSAVKTMGLASWIATVAMEIGARVGFAVGVKGLGVEAFTAIVLGRVGVDLIGAH